jgi:multidrug efflux pump
VAGSVVLSGLVALTLTPMLCAKILRVPKGHGRVYRVLEAGVEGVAAWYGRTLSVALRHRGLVILGALGVLVSAGLLFRSLKREFVPPEDRGWFITLVIAPEGSSLAFTDGYQRRAEAVLGHTKGVESYFSVVNLGDGVSRGIIFVNLDDWAARTRTVQDIIGEVQPQFFGIPGVFVFEIGRRSAGRDPVNPSRSIRTSRRSPKAWTRCSPAPA